MKEYIQRCLQLARLGAIGAHPNPMVGAVVTDSAGRIIGEGYHRVCGQAHAEVNAIADAERRGPLPDGCSIYVSLEPCAHWGKTPPCAQLIIDKGIKRCYVGCVDPFAKVQGRGIAMMREAGVEVILAPEEIAKECRDLNHRFFLAHTLGRPYVALKRAVTADGLVDTPGRTPDQPPLRISSPEGQVAVHRYRSTFDAIAVGSNTERMDSPRLDARLWPGGRAPRHVTFTREPLLPQLQALYRQGITSILIEGGPTLQASFLAQSLCDSFRLEQSL